LSLQKVNLIEKVRLHIDKSDDEEMSPPIVKKKPKEKKSKNLEYMKEWFDMNKSHK
jgi:hypothetical protein